MLSRRALLCSAGAAPLLLPFASAASHAQSDWPVREIHSICGFPPGSGADIFVRYYSRRLEAALGGKTVIVENKAGAFGNIATEFVAKSKPDGYTIMIAPGNSFLGAAPALFKKLSFDPVNDFEHITTLAKLPFILVVPGDSPHRSVADLTAFLKEKGDKASYGSIANSALVASELYKTYFGLPTVEVKYREPGSMFNDLWGRKIDLVYIDYATASGHIRLGRLRPLATTAGERLKALADIPSAREAGIMNMDLVGWWSVHAPRGTPKPILDRLEAAFNTIAVNAETTQFLANLGADPFPGNAASVRELLIKDTQAWAEYVRIARIDPI